MPTPPNPPSRIMSHVSTGANDFPRAKAFYDALLASLQIGVVVEHPGAVAYVRAFPNSGCSCRMTAAKQRASALGRTLGFWPPRARVDAFYAKALEMGGKGDGAPGNRAHYGPQYYGAFLRDLDGHKIEAMFRHASAG